MDRLSNIFLLSFVLLIVNVDVGLHCADTSTTSSTTTEATSTFTTGPTTSTIYPTSTSTTDPTTTSTTDPTTTNPTSTSTTEASSTTTSTQAPSTTTEAPTTTPPSPTTQNPNYPPWNSKIASGKPSNNSVEKVFTVKSGRCRANVRPSAAGCGIPIGYKIIAYDYMMPPTLRSTRHFVKVRRAHPCVGTALVKVTVYCLPEIGRAENRVIVMQQWREYPDPDSSSDSD